MLRTDLDRDLRRHVIMSVGAFNSAWINLSVYVTDGFKYFIDSRDEIQIEADQELRLRPKVSGIKLHLGRIVGVQLKPWRERYC